MNDLTYSYVALLDILAYKEYLAKDRESGRLDFKDALNNALAVLRDINQAGYYYRAISDTIIVTCSSQEKIVEFLALMKGIQIAFLKEGLFVRGAVVYAPHFHNENLTYSPALTKAYELEQKTAIYPRIVIDGNIIDMFSATETAETLFLSKLVYELNGISFLNILDKKNWVTVFKAARGMFQRDFVKLAGQESAFAKHVWFESFLFSSPYAKSGYDKYIPTAKELIKPAEARAAGVPKRARKFTFNFGKKPSRRKIEDE